MLTYDLIERAKEVLEYSGDIDDVRTRNLVKRKLMIIYQNTDFPRTRKVIEGKLADLSKIKFDKSGKRIRKYEFEDEFMRIFGGEK